MIEDDRLEIVLASLRTHLDTAPPWQPTRRRSVSPVAAAAAVVAFVVVAVVAIAPARRTFSGWFGIGNTEIRVDVDVALPADRLPSFIAGDAITPSRAAELTGIDQEVLDDSPLGPPVAWLAPPEGGAVAVWDDGGTTLWLLPVGPEQEQRFTKTVATAEQVRPLPDLGDGGILVGGTHVLETPHRRTRAGTAVLWTRGDVSARLESADPAADLLELAPAFAELVPGS